MLKSLDFVIIGIYILVLLFIGYVSGKDSKTSDEFFVANRQMSWIPVALSIAATTISANGFIGGPGWAYSVGIVPFMINIAVPFACFFAIWIVVPIIYHLKIISIYEYINLRFGERTKLLLVFHFFINSIIQVSSMVFIPSLFLVIITGWPLKIIVPIIVICSIAYTAMGGIKAVIWTDVFQMIIIWGSVLLIIYIAFDQLGISFIKFVQITKMSGKLDALNFDFSLRSNNNFWGTLLGGSIMWIRYFAFDQTQVQRILTANSIKTVKRSLLTSAVVMNIIYFFMLFIGIILFFFYRGKVFNNSNEIMINFILEEIPIGFLGLTIAGIFASVMSSVDSILNSMTTIFIKDIYEVYFKKEKKASTPKIISISTSLIFGILIIIFVIIGFGDSIRSVLETVGTYISYLVGPACAVFILGFFSRRIDDNGVSLGLVLGLVLGFIISKILNTGWIWNPFIGFILTCVLSCIYNIFIPNLKLEKNKYTIYEIINEIKRDEKENEEEVSLLPCCLDFYAISTLVFFIFQYIILFVIR
ncbi:sodium:solute symporter family transporter [Fusobacterium sp.]|uniref:sodium:solute symporter family transporter n=1 Tax=Fusobacterium sp. TaxID=68766 RepID=UPI00290179C9|nr:sodium/solute symporter [Fusobacterium sp.]MDU1910104.1 sodium/solute symporter [Fusobacterium sp.]